MAQSIKTNDHNSGYSFLQVIQALSHGDGVVEWRDIVCRRRRRRGGWRVTPMANLIYTIYNVHFDTHKPLQNEEKNLTWQLHLFPNISWSTLHNFFNRKRFLQFFSTINQKYIYYYIRL